MRSVLAFYIEGEAEIQKELLKQIRCLIEKEKKGVKDEHSITFYEECSLCFDSKRRLVWRSGQTITLTPMEFDILYLLARHPGCVFTARQIYETVAPANAEGSWTGVSNMIYKLRQKLGGDKIENIYGQGYRFRLF